MEISENQSSECSELRSSHQSSLQRTCEKVCENTETQSLTVEIKINVDKERKALMSEKQIHNLPVMTGKENEKNNNHEGSAERSNDKNGENDIAQNALQLVSTLRETDTNWSSSEYTIRPNDGYESYNKNRKRRSRGERRRRSYRTPDRSSRRRSRSRSHSRYRRRSRTPEKYVRRSRSRSRGRRSDRYRSRRSYSRINDERRSRSRGRSRYRSPPERNHRDRSYDRELRRSPSRSRQRRSRSHNRQSRSASRSPQRRVGQHRSLRSSSRDRDAKRWRNNSPKSCMENQQEKSASNETSTRDNNSKHSSKICENATADTDQKRKPEMSTIDLLRSRIRSTLMNSAGDWIQSTSICDQRFGVSSTKFVDGKWLPQNETAVSITRESFRGSVPNVEESMKSTEGANIDESIIEKIVSRKASTASVMQSNSNIAGIDMTTSMYDHMTFNPMIDSTVPVPGTIIAAQPTTHANNQFGRIMDPRIKKILHSQHSGDQSHQNAGFNQSSCGINVPQLQYPHNQPQHTTFSPYAAPSQTDSNRWNSGFSMPPPRIENRPVNKAPMTYGEYKRQQSLRAASNNNVLAAKSSVVPNVITKSTGMKMRRDETETVQPKPIGVKKAKEQNEVVSSKAVTTSNGKQKRKAVTDSEAVLSNEAKARKKEPKKTAASQLESTSKQSATNELQDSLNATGTGNLNSSSSKDQTTNQNAIETFKELMNNQNLRMFVDFLQHMTDPQLKNALNTSVSRTTERFVPVANELRDDPKKPANRKNELDRLHEDIDNMFIRDGVLNASGRRRSGALIRELSVSDDGSDSETGSPKQPKTSTFTSVSTRRSKVKKGKIAKTVKPIAVKQSNTKQKVKRRRGPSLIPLSNVIVPRVKNNNPEYHSSKKVVTCLVCGKTTAMPLISHYVNDHPDAEVLTSRICAEVAERLRSSKHNHQCKLSTGDYGSYIMKFFEQFCYFCNAEFKYSKQCWISHVIRHTGYYNFQCKTCSRKFSSAAKDHSCKPYNIVRTKPRFLLCQDVKAYVCDLCNYVRFFKSEIEKHLQNEHEDGERKGYQEFTWLYFPMEKRGRQSGAGKKPEFDSDYDYDPKDDFESETVSESEQGSDSEEDFDSEDENDSEDDESGDDKDSEEDDDSGGEKNLEKDKQFKEEVEETNDNMINEENYEVEEMESGHERNSEAFLYQWRLLNSDSDDESILP